MTEPNRFHILGPPGTGKTTTLTRQIRRAAEKNGMDRVMVASLTKTAAREIAGRVLAPQEAQEGPWARRRPKPGQKDWDALRGRVGTLHSICFHLLEMKRDQVADEQLEKWNDWHEHQARLEVVPGGKTRADDPFGEATSRSGGNKIWESINLRRARRIPEMLWSADEQYFYRKWRDWKSELGFKDYTDMIEQVLALGLPPPGDVRVGFFDECQDFSRLELDLVEHWAKSLEFVVLAYDDDQSIFGFRGADPAVLVGEVVAPDHVITLKQSYRVPRSIHGLAQSWIKRVEVRREKEYFPRDEDGMYASSPANRHNVVPLMGLINNEIDAGRTVMILTTCDYQLNTIIRELRERLIPFHNPYRLKNGRWNPLRHGNTSSGGRLLAFARISEELHGEGARLTVWTAEEMWQWCEFLDKRCFGGHGTKKRLQDMAKNEPGRTVLERDFLSEEACAWVSKGDLDAYAEHIVPSKVDAFRYPMRMLKKDPKLLTKTPQLTVGTVHSVKGGEADTVILFPDLSPSGAEQWRSVEGRDEIRRVFYVGMTRAKQKLYRCSACGNMAVQW